MHYNNQPSPNGSSFPGGQLPANFYQEYHQKPYEEEDFLDKTFNYKDEYIRAFKTLSHEVKLKFYLSLQEVKMLGHMSDRQGYQQILQEIARRVMLMGSAAKQ